MGNKCCFGEAGGTTAVGNTFGGGGGGGGQYNINNKYHPSNGPNDAVNLFLKSRGYNGLFSQIELSLSASSLRNRDALSKSDPMVVIYMKGRDGRLEEIGRTEVVLNSLDPTWIQKVNVTYHFEHVQTLLFRVYDIDTQFHNVDVQMLKLDEQQFLGEASCALSEIIVRSNRLYTLDLIQHEESLKEANPRTYGKLTIHAEESYNSKTTTEMILRCSDLENKDLFSKSDPFLVISKIAESGIPIPICKTEVVKDNLDPTWKPVSLNIQQVGSKV